MFQERDCGDEIRSSRGCDKGGNRKRKVQRGDGAYISTFNSTYVGMEKTAAFFNSLPYIVDELQIVDSRRELDVANFVKSVYGFFGQMVVNELLNDGVMDRLEERFGALYDELVRQHSIAQKQAQSGALILAADWLVTESYLDGPALTAAEIAPYLKSREAVSANRRAYEFVCEFITQNQTRFGLSDKTLELWGEFCDDSVYIVRSRFEQICREGGFNPASLLSWLADRGLIRRTDKNHMAVMKRIGSVPTRCVHLKLITENTDEADNSAVDEYPDF